MHVEKIEQLVNILKQKKDELIGNIKKLEDNGLSSSILNTTGELSSYDNHPADLATETFERAKDLGIKDNERVLLDNVRRALKKAEDGTYGQCEKCGREIGCKRLEVLPWATECINCSRLLKLENEGEISRPLEEKSLEPLFSRGFQYNNESTIENWKEDVLDLATQHGSSDTSQDNPGVGNYKNLIP